MKETRDIQESDLPAGLGAPAMRALSGAGCLSLEQVAALSETELKRLHGIGPKAVGLLRQALAAKGLTFASEKTGQQR